MLHIHYTGTLLDGTVFDSSKERDPLTFTLGSGKTEEPLNAFTWLTSFVTLSGQVIQGWDKGILGMCVGEVRKLQIPPELGYGSRAMGKIPANAVLIFEVELIKIERKEEF